MMDSGARVALGLNRPVVSRLWRFSRRGLVDLRAAGDSQMGRAGIEPATLGLKVPCSTN